MRNGFDYQRFYDSIASIYGLGMRLLPMWQDYIRQALPWLSRAGRILEIGPGPGWLQAQLKEYNYCDRYVDVHLGAGDSRLPTTAGRAGFGIRPGGSRRA